MRILILLFLGLALAPAPLAQAAKAKRPGRRAVKTINEAPVDWGAKAAGEIESARNEVAKPASKSKSTANLTNETGDTSTAKPVEETRPESDGRIRD